MIKVQVLLNKHYTKLKKIWQFWEPAQTGMELKRKTTF